MRKRILSNTLLTGAGFTKNFGGLLAKDMWSKMFNSPRLRDFPRLKDMLREDYDYESVYAKILEGQYTEPEKQTITNVIHQAYRELDEISRQWTYTRDAPYPVNIYGVNRFISLFAGDSTQIGLFFTINQDLFIERHYNSTSASIIHPGVRKIPDAHHIISRIPIEKSDYVRLPSEAEISGDVTNPLTASNFHYIKLHGSYGWKSSSETNRLVIGSNKEEQIAAEPLLSWYYNLFTQALRTQDAKLMIIGYGFKDRHINKVLAKACVENGLRLFAISPTEQSEFMEHLRTIEEYGDTIYKSIAGYFPYTLLDIFPADQSESHALREIRRSYFEG